MRLVALTCPGCGSPLPTVTGRRVFVCQTCRASCVPRISGELTDTGPGLTEIARNMLAPTVAWPQQPIVLLPMWVFPVRRSELDPVGAQRLPAMVRVPAVGVGRMPLLIDYAVHLTRCEVQTRVEPTPPHLAEPAELGLADAFEIAEVAALAHARGWPPDGEEERVELPFGSPALLDLPCAVGPVELTDLVFGRAAPIGMLAGQPLADCGPELRAAHPVS